MSENNYYEDSPFNPDKRKNVSSSTLSKDVDWDILTRLLIFVRNNYTYDYSEEANRWGYKHKKYGWHAFGNVYTERDLIEDFTKTILED